MRMQAKNYKMSHKTKRERRGWCDQRRQAKQTHVRNEVSTGECDGITGRLALDESTDGRCTEGKKYNPKSSARRITLIVCPSTRMARFAIAYYNALKNVNCEVILLA